MDTAPMASVLWTPLLVYQNAGKGRGLSLHVCSVNICCRESNCVLPFHVKMLAWLVRVSMWVRGQRQWRLKLKWTSVIIDIKQNKSVIESFLTVVVVLGMCRHSLHCGDSVDPAAAGSPGCGSSAVVQKTDEGVSDSLSYLWFSPAFLSLPPPVSFHFFSPLCNAISSASQV